MKWGKEKLRVKKRSVWILSRRNNMKEEKVTCRVWPPSQLQLPHPSSGSSWRALNLRSHWSFPFCLALQPQGALHSPLSIQLIRWLKITLWQIWERLSLVLKQSFLPHPCLHRTRAATASPILSWFTPYSYQLLAMPTMWVFLMSLAWVCRLTSILSPFFPLFLCQPF